MVDTLIPPTFRRIIDDLTRRIGVLEGRVQPDKSGCSCKLVAGTGATITGSGSNANPYVISAAGGGLDGTGDHAIAAAHSGDTATSSGSYATAIGTDTVADATEAIAIGGGATAPAAAHAGQSVAIGPNTLIASGHTNSVALGNGTWTRVANQVTTGVLRLMMGTPNSAPADADLGLNQVSFYLDEGSNLLRVKVKYSDGTVKTGAVSVS